MTVSAKRSWSPSGASQRTSTWLDTTSLMITARPLALSLSANRCDSRVVRSTRSATPCRPRDRRVAYTPDAAGAAGEFGDPVHRVACVRALFEVTGLYAHRGPVRGRVAADRDSAVVGDVEQLVSVGGPGVESVEAVDTIDHGG